VRVVRAPFRMLDPGLDDAEALLVAADSAAVSAAGGGPARGGDLSTVRSILAALPDETAATGALNAALVACGARPYVCGRRLLFAGADPHRAQALAMLAVLVTVDGWRRLRRCVRCGRPYLDRTNGATRLGCARHLAH
jgi:hypothetical protein